MSQLTQNTTDLDALIAKANALPDAGGGGSVETCTVTISGTSAVIGCTVFKNNEISTAYNTGSSVTFENVVCGSAITIPGVYITYDATDGEFVNIGAHPIYKAPTTAGAIATVTVSSD